MVKIIHYEVYANRGDGWKLVDQFSADQRQEAVNLAKEIETEDQVAVIIREIFDVQDNTYQESVEYIGGLGRKKKAKSSKVSSLFNNFNGEYNVEYVKTENEKSPPRNSMMMAIGKLVSIIILSLVFANLLVSLIEPVVEVVIPEDRRKSVMFVAFFVIFLLIALPLILKKVPWSAFYAHNERKKSSTSGVSLIKRKQLSAAIISMTNMKKLSPRFIPKPRWSIKDIIVEFLTQILGNLETGTSLHDSFTRLGIKLIVYGGCLELSRYCGLIISEANSLLNESFKILDGDKADLSAFYEAKRTYKDNKVAIFLTGVGAYLMAQVIKDVNMDAYILKATLKKWTSLNKQPEPLPEEIAVNSQASQENDIMFKCIASLKTTVNFYDDEHEVSAEDISVIRGQIRNIIANLVSKLEGGNVIEANEITSVEFAKLNNAARFVVDFLNDIEAFKEQSGSEGLLLDNKCCILEMPTEDEPNLSPYLADIFEQTYNNEIIVNDTIKDELTDSRYEFEYLGEKKLSRSGQSAALYKLVY